MLATMQFETAFLTGLNYIQFSYENDLANEEAFSLTYNKILDAIGVRHYPFKIMNSKVTPIKHSDFIVNYDEILNDISPTEFGSYLPPRPLGG